jgi:hypothetical protein
MFTVLDKITLGDLIAQGAADKRARWLRQSTT